jgi:hypothetical protein
MTGFNSGDGYWDFNFVVLKNNHAATWPDSFGNTLMGSDTTTDGKGNLNLNEDVLYDSGIFPVVARDTWNGTSN